MTWLTKIFHCSKKENELKSYHNKTNWANFVWMQDCWMLLKLDNTSWRKTLRNSHNFMQWPVVNTLFQKEEASQPKGWIQGNTKIGPVLEVATCCLHGKYGVEIRISSVNRENTHSWVRISHGSNKVFRNLNNSEQENSEMQFEDYALMNASDFASRSKAKAKPQRREPAGSSPRTVPVEKRTWTDVEPGKYSFSDHEVSNKLIHLLRHGQHVHREDDGAVQFWRIKENLQKYFLYCPWQSRRRRKQEKDTSTVLILQEHLRISELFKDIQDAILLILLCRTLFIPNNFFQYIYHVGCAINLHSIINSGLTQGGPNLSKRQTVFFLPVDPMDKNHKDPDTIDLEAPRHEQ